ncbi:MAG: KUP/HAK/KT family potassium transporter [Phycisphaerales bacterium]|nr:KUP/HAK/KT family potassium transporter [Phycisphaerales bacterium]
MINQGGLPVHSSKNNINKVTAGALLVALGIIYGDLGTSPLYTFKPILTLAGANQVLSTAYYSPDKLELLLFGSISLIFWTLTFQTTIKYVYLTLMADNDGEGGIFSLYALVRRYGKYLIIPTIVGAAALLADGILTPPISVASAIEGLTMMPGLKDIPTVPIVMTILCLLFFFQRFGTQKIGTSFGPFMTIWFLMIMILGIKEIIKYPTIIKAINPYYGYLLLSHYKGAFWLLGSIFLCTTGAEALYSDLGHCGLKNIRITWWFVKISCVCNYLGQAAWLLRNKQYYLFDRNPFFTIVPDGFLLPVIIIATIATVIASQALISGAFTMISEASSMNFWPRVKILRPSNFKGQMYIPSINLILWFGCLISTWYFQTSANMEAAFGFSITVAMMMTTYLLTFFLLYKKKWNIYLVVGILIVFGIIECSFFITNAAKIKQRWMFLFFEFGIFTTMYVWYYARKINNSFEHFVDVDKYCDKIKELSTDTSVPSFATHLIYLTKANNLRQIEERVIKSIFSKNPKRANVYWFLHIHRTDEPYTLAYDVNELVEDTIIKINIYLGFRVQPRSEVYFKKIVQELVKNEELNLHKIPDGSNKYNSEPDYKFVICEKYLSKENDFSLKEGFLIHAYFTLHKYSLSDEQAYGLDKSDVIIEKFPLVYQPIQKFNLTRLN